MSKLTSLSIFFTYRLLLRTLTVITEQAPNVLFLQPRPAQPSPQAFLALISFQPLSYTGLVITRWANI